MHAVTTLLQNFERYAVRTPAAKALVCDSEVLTYAELDAHAARVAGYLQTEGAERGDLIGLSAAPSAEFIIGMLGILKAGCAWVPIASVGASQRRRDVIKQAGVTLLLCDQPAADLAVRQLPIRTALAAGSVMRSVAPDPDALCYVMFTSGTTGTPNGVMVSHANVAGLYAELQDELAWSVADHWAALHAPTFGFSVWEVWGALSTGACLHMVPEEHRADPVQWFPRLLDAGVTVLSITPSGFRQLLAAEILPAQLDALRLIVFSGEAVRPDDIAAWRKRYGESGPRLINTYALTETAGRISWHEYLPNVAVESGCIGRPIAPASVRLLDEDRKPVPQGEEGELYVGGPMVAHGYINAEELTAERFVTFEDSQLRYYRTGDAARITAAGEIVFTGRRDAQIKLRGHRIELGEIEACIRRNPSVQDAAVVLQTNGAAPQLTAFVQSVADHNGVQFWPSLGEYQIYDELLYDFMSADETRVASYKRAFERNAAGKVVLDIGTGKDAILARLAAAAGARHVYAVEVLDDACKAASELIAALGLTDRITVLHGDMQTIELPESVDIVTQGIIGNIGSSDGIGPIWNSARDAFNASYAAIPSVCTTLFAPAELTESSGAGARFSALAAHYTREVFAGAGQPFDVRLCVRNFPQQNLLADAAEFERLDFDGELPTHYQSENEFVVARAGAFDGFLLWTRIQTDAQEYVDFFEHQQAWLPVWFPLTDESVPVGVGDRIQVQWKCATPAGQVFPDYEIEAELLRVDGSAARFSYQTRHFEQQLGATALHRSLLRSIADADADLADWLAGQLPDYMQPARWVQLPELPLNSSGKLDRARLADWEAPSELPVATGSDDPLVNAMNRIWCDVLGAQQLSNHADFFAAGGDSILAVRLTTEVQRYLDDTVFLAGLFDAPTIHTYCDWLRQEYAESVAQVVPASDQPLLDELVAGARDGAAVALSYPQQSLLFLQQLYPDNTGANEQFMIRMRGTVDFDRLSKAWRAMLTNHDILRTEFHADSQQAVAVETCLTREALDRADLSGQDAVTAAEMLAAAAAAALARRFDLNTAPLLRAILYRMPDDEHVLLVTAHHIIADGMCVQLMRNELARAYAEPAALPAPAYQYADFAVWQRRVISDETLSDPLQWWQARLQGHSGQPVNHALAAVGDGGEARFAFCLEAPLADRLKEIAREAGATPFMLLLAAWRVWLTRCLGEPDLLLGSPVTLRRQSALADMLGCMVNNVVFRNVTDSGCDFTALLAAERDGVLAALAHSDVPFEKLVERIQPEREWGRHPLFQLMFLFEDRSDAVVESAGVEFTADVLPVDRATYRDLELSVTDCGVGKPMPAFIGVRRDVYDAHALAWWPEGFVSMLEQIAEQPATKLADLPLLSDRQRHQVLVDWNNTGVELPVSSTLHEMVLAQAKRTPDAIAVRDQCEALSYGELVERATMLAGGLRARGVMQGDLVGLSLERGSACIALQLAILMNGAAWLPLDPNYPLSRLELMVGDARPRFIVTDASGVLADRPDSIALTELKGAPLAQLSSVSGDDIAYALYTSGSTGHPKGVLATHASAVSRCQWMWQEYAFSKNDVFGQRTSLNFVDSVWEIFGALGHGASVSVLPADQEHDPAAILSWVKTNQVSHMALVPSMLRALLDICDDSGAPASLHTLISSGEMLSADLARQVHSVLPGCRLLNTYGTSETWDVSCYEVVPELADERVSVGRPVGNAALCILDESQQPVPPGVEGELYAGGLGLARGYLGQPELTAQRFISSPLAELSATRLYRTGDRARFRADGNVELLGRLDRQIKLRGIRIETGDIEAQTLKHADVKDCAVVLRSSPTDAAEWLALYIVPVDQRPDPEEVRQFLFDRLPRAMVPADINVLDVLPLTPSGKLDVGALPADELLRPVQTEFIAPRSELEEQLAAIWAEALDTSRVGINDNFFALRGHSLLATQVIARVGETVGLEVPLQCLFESPTVAGLARSIEALRWAGTTESLVEEAGDREVLRL